MDVYSRGHSTPALDPIQNYMTVYNFNNTHVTFTSDRPLNTGDSNDYIIPLVSRFFNTSLYSN